MFSGVIDIPWSTRILFRKRPCCIPVYDASPKIVAELWDFEFGLFTACNENGFSALKMSFDFVEIYVFYLVDSYAFFCVVFDEEHVKQWFLFQGFYGFVESQTCSLQIILRM